MSKPMTDEQWIKQNTHLGPDACKKRGLCTGCGGKRGNYWAHGGERGFTSCQSCQGTGRAHT